MFPGGEFRTAQCAFDRNVVRSSGSTSVQRGSGAWAAALLRTNGGSSASNDVRSHPHATDSHRQRVIDTSVIRPPSLSPG